MAETSEGGSFKATEDQLADWGDAQRQAYREGKLTPEKIALIEAIPGWSWDA